MIRATERSGEVFTTVILPRYEALRDHVSVYPDRMDACYLDDERVTAQEGGFYGGWITADIRGPFKGPVGTFGW